MRRRSFVGGLLHGAMLGAFPWWRLADQRAIVEGRPYHMVVLGDSIAWGQGLLDDEKYSTLVQNWLAEHLGGQKVVKWTFAHSGAVLGVDADDNRAPLPGEVPVPYPSVAAQLTYATNYLAHHPLTDADHAAPVSPPEVSLVLVDGGINDVNVRNILTVDPTITDPESWIRGLARHRCVERMQSQLLPRLLATFPNAHIVVTGYYAIVSQETRLGDLEVLLDHLGLLGALGSLGVTDLVRKKLAGQCTAFADETATGLAEVVPKSQPLQVSALSMLQGRTQPVRVRAHFVDCRMAPDEAFGAAHTKLWGIPASDPVAHEREQECNALGASVDHLTCIEASAGHPNVGGARLIADRIVNRLNCIMSGATANVVVNGLCLRP